MRDGLADVADREGVPTLASGRHVAGGVDLGGAQRPAGALGDHAAVAKGATQGGDVGLKRLGRGARRFVAPHQLDERVGGHHRPAVQPQHGEDGTGFGTGDRDRQSVLPDAQRPKNPQLHLLKRNHMAIVGRPIQHTVKIG